MKFIVRKKEIHSEHGSSWIGKPSQIIGIYDNFLAIVGSPQPFAVVSFRPTTM